MDSLFKSDLTDVEWVTLCGGNDDKDGNEESCLELAEVDGGYAIRNTQHRDGGATFATGDELSAFVAGLKERGIVA